MSSRYWKAAVGVALVAVLLAVFPPFHIRKLGARISQDGDAANVARLATELWKSIPQAHSTDLQLLLESAPAERGPKFGHRPGIGGPWFYLVSGTAQVTAVDTQGVWLATHDGLRAVLQTGPIFGSALRDATGAVKFEDLSSTEFNQLSEQLNRLCEAQAQPQLRHDARVGAVLQFVAAGRLNTNLGDGRTLLLAPIKVTAQ